jgi:hypothetical protein
MQCRWDEHLELPVKYSALPLNAVLAINVVENVRPGATATVAGTTMPLFGKKGCVRQTFLPRAVRVPLYFLLHIVDSLYKAMKLEAHAAKPDSAWGPGLVTRGSCMSWFTGRSGKGGSDCSCGRAVVRMPGRWGRRPRRPGRRTACTPWTRYVVISRRRIRVHKADPGTCKCFYTVDKVLISKRGDSVCRGASGTRLKVLREWLGTRWACQ